VKQQTLLKSKAKFLAVNSENRAFLSDYLSLELGQNFIGLHNTALLCTFCFLPFLLLRKILSVGQNSSNMRFIKVLKPLIPFGPSSLRI
jgi:hypothetical protein